MLSVEYQHAGLYEGSHSKLPRSRPALTPNFGYWRLETIETNTLICTDCWKQCLASINHGLARHKTQLARHLHRKLLTHAPSKLA